MERTNQRTVDELGRIILPIDFRRRLRWEPGDEIAIHLEEDTEMIRLELHKKGAAPSEN